MIKKLLISALLTVNIYALEYDAPMFQFWKNLDWSFFFDKFEISLDLCTCDIKSSTQSIAGLKMTIVEPIGAVEVSNTPWNFVGFGLKLDKSLTRKQGSSRNNEGVFRWGHFIIFPPLGLTFGLMQDFICFERGNMFNMAFLSEVLPTYTNDLLALSEEATKPVSKVWFANTVAELACSADCASSHFGKPINSLYWCAGCRGGVGAGDSGHIGTSKAEAYEQAEVIAFRILNEMHFYGGMLKTKESTFSYQPSGTKLKSSLCEARYFPVIIKDQYYLQAAKNTKGSDALPFGDSRTNYDFKSSNEDEDDVFFWVWREKDFCAGAMKCKSSFGSF